MMPFARVPFTVELEENTLPSETLIHTFYPSYFLLKCAQAQSKQMVAQNRVLNRVLNHVLNLRVGNKPGTLRLNFTADHRESYYR